MARPPAMPEQRNRDPTRLLRPPAMPEQRGKSLYNSLAFGAHTV